MDRLQRFINLIEDLSTRPKQLTPEAIEHLKQKCDEYMKLNNTNELSEILPFIITYTYNESYIACINDILQELRRV